MTRFTRAAIGLKPAEGHYLLDRDQVEGIAIHWPGMPKPVTGFANVAAAIRSWQHLHMEGNGWSDIAYQEAVDQAGNSYVLRGLRYRSGANGDQDVNVRFGALLLVLAEGEKPTAAMIATVKRRVARHRDLFPHSHAVVGHQQVRPEPTACPGPIAMGLIKAGAFTPKEPKK